MKLGDLLSALRRSWWLILLPAVLGVAAAIGWTAVTPRTYATSETFFVTTPAKGAVDVYQGSLFSAQRVQSYAVLLTDDRLAGEVAQDRTLGLTAPQIQARIHAQTIPNSVLLKVSVTDTDPDRSTRVAQAVADEFIKLVQDLETAPGDTTSTVKVELVAGPTLEPTPVSPRPVRNIALGLLAGLLLGGAVAVARDRLDNTVKIADALAVLTGAPVLATVPFESAGRRHPLVMGGTGHSLRAEAFRQLRTNVQFLDADEPVKLLTVTSALAGEGKSTTAINLAIAFADAGLRVLLVEADLRRPQVAEYLGLEGSVGLSNVLARQVPIEDVIQPWGTRGLRVLPSGFIPPNPSELLGSAAMAALLQQLRRRFDLIIVDTPPLLPVTDAAVISAKTDGAILVTRSGRTTGAQVAKAAADLRAVDARVLGCVLNMKPNSRGDAGAYYEYGQRPSADASAPAVAADGGRGSEQLTQLIPTLARTARRRAENAAWLVDSGEITGALAAEPGPSPAPATHAGPARSADGWPTAQPLPGHGTAPSSPEDPLRSLR